MFLTFCPKIIGGSIAAFEPKSYGGNEQEGRERGSGFGRIGEEKLKPRNMKRTLAKYRKN